MNIKAAGGPAQTWAKLMPFTRTFTAREDSGSANNPALNLTGDPAVVLTFINEDANGNTGDLILDQPVDGSPDPDTQVIIDGTSYSFTFELSGFLPTQKKNGSQQVPDQFEGSEVYIITVHDYPTPGETIRFAFMPGESASLAEMDAFGNGAIDVQNADNTPPPGAVCFGSGTLILTPDGEKAIEDLRPGDLVTTLDRGPCAIQWISRSQHAWPGSPDKEKPILITSGSIGAGKPVRDLVVSPQHRILLDGPEVMAAIGTEQVLAPACGLIDLPGVRQMAGKRRETYHHILLENHAILVADGAPAESFFPGETAVGMLSAQQRRDLTAVLARLGRGVGPDYGPMARQALTRRKARRLVDNLNTAPTAPLCVA